MEDTTPQTPSITVPILYRDSTPPEDFQTAIWNRVFNAALLCGTRQPAAVATPRTAGEVSAAVRLAIKHKYRVSVRSGGHSWAAWSVRDGALILDLGQMTEPIEYDEKSAVVSCPPATTGRILNGFLESKKRFFPGGHCPDVGLGGFLLQGGMGWNCKVRKPSPFISEFVYIASIALVNRWRAIAVPSFPHCLSLHSRVDSSAQPQDITCSSLHVNLFHTHLGSMISFQSPTPHLSHLTHG
jgi:hypothetical protein